MNVLVLAAPPAANDSTLSPLVWAGASVAALVVLLVFGVLVARQYKRCPSNRILVIFGKVGHGRSSKRLHGGGAFVMPLVQDYAYLSLEPLIVKIEGARLKLKGDEKLDFTGLFTVAISTDPVLMNNAAERLLNMPEAVVGEQATHVILGQVKLVVGVLAGDEIDDDLEKFTELLNENIGQQLAPLGLQLINLHIQRIDRKPT